MWLYILGFVVVAVVILLLVASSQPSDFRIARDTTIQASPAKVFAYLHDFRQWEHWSPWAKLDPNMQQEFSGPPSGVGAHYAWKGNSKVGEGRMTVEDCQPDHRLGIKLEFLKPFACTNRAQFDLQPQGEATHVTWSMTGRNNFMAKLFGLLVNMDKLLGRDFEKGLASLKSSAEAG